MLTRRKLLQGAAVGMAALFGPGDAALAALSKLAAHAKPRFLSRPDLNPPIVAIDVRTANLGAEHLFIASFFSPNTAVVSQYGPQILDLKGNTVWFKPLGTGTSATAFRAQTYEGKPVLTWWEGPIETAGYGNGECVILDSSYREIKRFSAGHGHKADLHEFLLTPQGTALITVYDEIAADLSPVNGPSPGLLLDSIVQEIDVATGRVLFEWHSWGHVGVEESKAFLPKPGLPYDYFHVNSVDVDYDGNLLISARNTSTIYKIDRQTGAIIWRLGGKHSDFVINDGAQFGWQHDARRRPDGTISLFDNAVNGVPGQAAGPQSRGLALDLDMTFMQASRSIDYVHPDGLAAAAMGSLQTLPTGEVVIGWGLKPHFTGFTHDAKLNFDAELPAGGQSYRAFLLPWVGHPDDHPAIATESNHNRTTTVHASWNGATELASWRVLAGPHATALKSLHHAAAPGFETAVTVPVSKGFVAVEALDKHGRVLGTSKPRPV